MYFSSMPYSRKLSPADKARRTRLNKLIDTLEAGLAKCENAAQVAELFEAQPHGTPAQRELLADAFMELDNSHRTINHAFLRQARNTHELGRRIFALWA